MTRNSETLWDAFDPEWYYQQNYRRMLPEDREILTLMRDFFGTHAKSAPSQSVGVDVGTGSNLYPALAMLPFCHSIELQDVSPSNVRWLHDSLTGSGERWKPYWEVLSQHPEYGQLQDPWSILRDQVTISTLDILRPRSPQWRIGTMFFTAESISTDIDEFRDAMRNFASGLVGNAPFAVGFMLGSAGYLAADDDTRFPAVSLNEDHVRSVLSELCVDLQLHSVSTSSPFRPGYGSLLLALGIR